MTYTSQRKKDLQGVIIDMRRRIERRSISADRLCVLAVLLLPFVYLAELLGNDVLQCGSRGLSCNLRLNLRVDRDIALCQGRILQRILAGYLCPCIREARKKGKDDENARNGL